jgi:hypothetical protein
MESAAATISRPLETFVCDFLCINFVQLPPEVFLQDSNSHFEEERQKANRLQRSLSSPDFLPNYGSTSGS